MTTNDETYIADLHTKAAYAHTAAAHSHSTGNHASAQELAKKALGDSLEAAKYVEVIAKNATQSTTI